MPRSTHVIAVAFVLLLVAQGAQSHCQVPCGIYDDEMRLDMIDEHITTVEKAMKMIVALSEDGDANYNQLVRWINSKETHATEIQSIVSEYFMTQRVKPAGSGGAEAEESYVSQLTLLHEMLVYAMKAKQSTDTGHALRLRELLDAFRAAYLGPDDREHKH